METLQTKRGVTVRPFSTLYSGNSDMQRSVEWFVQRKYVPTTGAIRVTASRVGDFGKTRRKEFVDELLGRPPSENRRWLEANYKVCCEWGVSHEMVALAEYDIANRSEGTLYETGFCVHPAYPRLGGSPDGIWISNDEEEVRVLEIKCKFNKTLFESHAPAKPQSPHVKQLKMNMWTIACIMGLPRVKGVLIYWQLDGPPSIFTYIRRPCDLEDEIYIKNKNLRNFLDLTANIDIRTPEGIAKLTELFPEQGS